jgi:hypothetical protein
MPSPPDAPRLFTLEEARELLPTIKRLTAEAVRDTEALAELMRDVPDDDPRHAELTMRFERIVGAWAEKLQSLDVQAKGLWLVDFDTGNGYYCWCYPEETLDHYHAYEGGFSERMRIV